ncbi:hypothetical protein CUP1780 [Campylobacter upsaliensis RM3195]|nr:hypothetical protein CUP1780 [Campylobacter upsaliensis RM3195]
MPNFENTFLQSNSQKRIFYLNRTLTLLIFHKIL